MQMSESPNRELFLYTPIPRGYFCKSFGPDLGMKSTLYLYLSIWYSSNEPSSFPPNIPQRKFETTSQQNIAAHVDRLIGAHPTISHMKGGNPITLDLCSYENAMHQIWRHPAVRNSTPALMAFSPVMLLKLCPICACDVWIRGSQNHASQKLRFL